MDHIRQKSHAQVPDFVGHAFVTSNEARSFWERLTAASLEIEETEIRNLISERMTSSQLLAVRARFPVAFAHLASKVPPFGTGLLHEVIVDAETGRALTEYPFQYASSPEWEGLAALARCLAELRPGPERKALALKVLEAMRRAVPDGGLLTFAANAFASEMFLEVDGSGVKDVSKAAYFLSAAIDFAEECGGSAQEIGVLHTNLGVCVGLDLSLDFIERSERALTHFQCACKLLATGYDKSVALNNLGKTLLDLSQEGDLKEADDALTKALRIKERLCVDSGDIARTRMNLARVKHQNRHNVDPMSTRSIKLDLEAASEFVLADMPAEAAWAHLNASIHSWEAADGDPDLADYQFVLDQSHQALILVEKLDVPILVSQVSLHRSRVFREQGDIFNALLEFRKSLPHAAAHETVYWNAAFELGYDLAKSGEFEAAVEVLLPAIDLAERSASEANDLETKERIIGDLHQAPRIAGYSLMMIHRYEDALSVIERSKLHDLKNSDFKGRFAPLLEEVLRLDEFDIPVAFLVSSIAGAGWVVRLGDGAFEQIGLSVNSANIVAMAMTNGPATGVLFEDVQIEDRGPGLLMNLGDDPEAFSHAWSHFGSVIDPVLARPLLQFLKDKGINSVAVTGPTITVDIPWEGFLHGVKVLISPSLRLSGRNGTTSQRLAPNCPSSLAIFAPFPKELVFSLFEARNQKALWSGESELYEGREANSTTFCACSADIRVVSSHALSATASGSTLLLADGLWTPFAATTGNFSGAIFILNCCATSEQGFRNTGPDESFRLPTALLLAGAAAVVSTRWSVDDDAAACFGIRLVHLLNRGDKLDDAVYQARCWLRDSTAMDLLAWLRTLDEFGANDFSVRLSALSESTRPFSHARHWAAFSLWI
jgi:tetratricopeptide (TPR) repeat protein